MLIDWFTVVAQILNFLVLVWLLKRFLYKPILNAIAEREKIVATEMREAGQAKERADKERTDFENKNNQFDLERAALLRKATGEAENQKQELLEKTRQEVAGLKARLEDSVKANHDQWIAEIGRRANEEVFNIVRKVLSDLASAKLDDQIADMFVQRIQSMDEQDRTRFAKALNTSNEDVLVRSAFPLTAAKQSGIRQAAKKIAGVDHTYRFEIKPDEINGVEIVTPGYKLSWNISEYLKALEKHVSEAMGDHES